MTSADEPDEGEPEAPSSEPSGRFTIDPRLLESLMPKVMIDPKVLESMLPTITISPSVLQAVTEHRDALDQGTRAALKADLNRLSAQTPWSSVDALSPTIEPLYEKQILHSETPADEDTADPWEHKTFRGPAAIALGSVIICILVASGAATPGDFKDVVSVFVGLLGYEDLHNYTFHGLWMLAVLAVALWGNRKSS